MSVKTITGSALLLAIALLSQGFLRMIIPVHGLVQFLVGSIVGACTAIATWRYGLWSGFLVACLTPLMAFVQGMLTIVKSIVLYGLFLELFQLMPGIPEAMQKGILFSMGWPQLVTGTCGVLLASVIVKRSRAEYNKRV